MQKAMSFNNFPVVYAKGSPYRINFGLIKGVLYKFFALYIKMSESVDLTYYQRNRDVILNTEKRLLWKW